MYNNIMLALGDPVLDRPVLTMALRLARRSSARLHIVSVHKRGALHDSGPSKQDMTAFVESAAEELPELVSFELIETDRPGRRAHIVAEELAAYATTHFIDLIVLGTHAWGMMGRLLLGSVVTKLTHDTSVPILMIPRPLTAPQATPPQMRRIVVALDPSGLDATLVADAAEIARLMDGSITLFNIVEPEPETPGPSEMPLRHEEFVLRCARSEEYLDRLAEPLREEGIPVHTVTAPSASVATGVRVVADVECADLVVFGAPSESTLVNSLITGARCALLVRGTEVPELCVVDAGEPGP